MTQTTPEPKGRLSRRHLLRALLALPVLALIARMRPTKTEDIVEVDGWILKRSDLS